jgi:hypothetical protein
MRRVRKIHEAGVAIATRDAHPRPQPSEAQLVIEAAADKRLRAFVNDCVKNCRTRAHRPVGELSQFVENPMKIRFGSTVPPGQYRGKFAGCSKSKPHPDYGEGFVLDWTITAGKYAGERIGRVVGTRPTVKNAFGKLLRGLLGRQPQPAEDVDLDVLVGKEYWLMVEESDSGSTRVGSAVAVNTNEPSGPAAPVDDDGAPAF